MIIFLTTFYRFKTNSFKIILWRIQKFLGPGDYFQKWAQKKSKCFSAGSFAAIKAGDLLFEKRSKIYHPPSFISFVFVAEGRIETSFYEKDHFGLRVELYSKMRWPSESTDYFRKIHVFVRMHTIYDPLTKVLL